MHNRAAQDGEVGFEEGKLWLPTQVLYEACDTKARQQHLKPFQHHRGGHHRHHRRVSRSLPDGELPSNNSKSSPMRPPYRPKYVQNNWASGGPGMQAIFLGSNQKSCGTGVFLPQIRTAGNNNHPNTNKKPACAPVLLPSRVVQALNLDVQALGLQISPRQDLKNNQKGEDRINISVKSKKGNVNKDVPSSQCSVISQKEIRPRNCFFQRSGLTSLLLPTFSFQRRKT